METEEIEYPRERLTQVVRYKCCDKIFAACVEPHCYSEADWQRDVRKHIKQGCRVEMIKGKVKFGTCVCAENNQTKIF